MSKNLLTQQMIVIPAELIDDLPKIGATALAVYCAMRRAGSGCTEYDIVQITGFSASEVKLSLRLLENYEYIVSKAA